MAINWFLTFLLFMFDCKKKCNDISQFINMVKSIILNILKINYSTPINEAIDTGYNG